MVELMVCEMDLRNQNWYWFIKESRVFKKFVDLFKNEEFGYFDEGVNKANGSKAAGINFRFS